MKVIKTMFFLFLSNLLFITCEGSGSKKQFSYVGLDKYGGLSDISGNNTSGFFRTQLINNRWVLIDPDNHLFFSLGVNHVAFNGDNVPDLGYSEYTHNLLSLFPSIFSQYAQEQWSEETIMRYKNLGFNTLGAWSDNGLTVFYDSIPYTVILNFAPSVENGFGSNNCPFVSIGFSSNFPDVYDPRFQENAYAYAHQSIMSGYITDPWLIGYFIDNELSWFGGAQLIYNQYHTLADDFIALPPTYAGKQYWVNIFLRQKLGYSLDQLNKLYGTSFASWAEVLNTTQLANNTQHQQIQIDKQAFIYDIASTYFSVTSSAIKSIDPNHLNLCARFASDAPDQVIEASSQYCDVISVNDYYTLDNQASNAVLGDPLIRWARFFTLTTIHNKYGKPFIQSEFGTRAMDSGLPNSKGAGWSVMYQNDRANYYNSDINRLLSIKVNGITFLSGFHWFEWTDEPATGRFDGENSNYGVVNIKDELYLTFSNNISNANKVIISDLNNSYNSLLSPVNFITATTTSNNTTVLSWNTVNGAYSYTVILSPYRSMPSDSTLTFNGITTNYFEIPYQLPNGTWWVDIKATGLNNIQGDYVTPTSFTVNTPISDIQSCITMDNPGCFVNNITDTFPHPNTTIGDGFVLPEQSIHDQGTSSCKITFSLNSLAFQAGLPLSTIVFIDMNKPIFTNGFNTLYFDVYPEVVYTPSGKYRSATDFVHFRLLNNNTIIYDSPLPASLPPYSWSTVGITLSGTTFSEITPLFYVDALETDIPIDQRIKFFIDNLVLK